MVWISREKKKRLLVQRKRKSIMNKRKWNLKEDFKSNFKTLNHQNAVPNASM